MKRKVFSLLTLGLMLFTSMAMVSCKDYDDDINDANQHITDLTAVVNALKSQHEADVAALQAADREFATKIALKDTAAALRAEAQAAAAQAELRAIERAQELANGLQTQISENQNGLSDLTEELEELKANVAAINTDLLKKINENSADIANEETARKAADLDLQNQIEALQIFQSDITGKVGELGTAVDAMNAALKAAQDDLATIKEQIANLDVASVKEFMNKANERLAQLEADYAALKAAIDKKADQADLDELAKQVAQNKGNIAKNAELIGVNTKDIAANKSAIATLQEALNTLNLYIDKTLTSLVYKPGKYVLGFGAIPVYTIENTQTYGEFNTKLSRTGETYKAIGTETLNPNAHAIYHMNPSTADYTKYTFSFVDLETTDETRGHNDATSIEPKVVKVEPFSGNIAGEYGDVEATGNLDVELNINGANVNDAHVTDGVAWISTIALQATKKNLEGTDASVTSDYALVAPTWIKALILANNKYKANAHEEGAQLYHVDKTATKAISDYETAGKEAFRVSYDGKDSLDLDEYMEIHYTQTTTVDGDASAEKVMTLAEAKTLGLTVTYTNSPYLNKNNVDESKYLTVKGSKVAAATGEISAAGHCPLVRVEVKSGDKTVLVGYVTILITNDKEIAATETLDTDLYVNCTNTIEFPWSDVKAQLMQKLGLDPKNVADVKEFDANYTEFYAAGLNTDADAAQFTSQNIKDKLNPKNGVVSLVKKGNAIDSLKWYFSQDATRKAFYNADGTVKKDLGQEVWVSAQSSNSELHPNMWIKLVIPAEKVKMVSSSLSNEQKIQQYWYAQYLTTAGYDEIHGSVQVPATNNTCEFNYDMFSTFVGNKASVTLTNTKFASFTDLDADVYFNSAKYPETVKGASGAEYQLNVSDDNKTLTATLNGETKNVVVLTGDNNNVAEYQKNDFAFDVLNYAGHKALGSKETLTSHMMLVNDHNCLPLPISNNTFDVRYLRPLDIDADKVVNITDGVDDGSKVYIYDLVSFTDWRDYKFADHLNYFEYYGVTALTPDIENVTTNINGKTQKLSEVTSLMKFEDHTTPLTTYPTTATGLRDAFGYLFYINNTSTVRDFELYVPVKVSYKWGNTQTVNVTIHVKKTVNNAKRGF